jgi:hypothetical protein
MEQGLAGKATAIRAFFVEFNMIMSIEPTFTGKE